MTGRLQSFDAVTLRHQEQRQWRRPDPKAVGHRVDSPRIRLRAEGGRLEELEPPPTAQRPVRWCALHEALDQCPVRRLPFEPSERPRAVGDVGSRPLSKGDRPPDKEAYAAQPATRPKLGSRALSEPSLSTYDPRELGGARVAPQLIVQHSQEHEASVAATDHGDALGGADEPPELLELQSLVDRQHARL